MKKYRAGKRNAHSFFLECLTLAAFIAILSSWSILAFDLKRIGCYKDSENRIFQRHLSDSNYNTPTECAQRCVHNDSGEKGVHIALPVVLKNISYSRRWASYMASAQHIPVKIEKPTINTWLLFYRPNSLHYRFHFLPGAKPQAWVKRFSANIFFP